MIFTFTIIALTMMMMVMAVASSPWLGLRDPYMLCNQFLHHHTVAWHYGYVQKNVLWRNHLSRIKPANTKDAIRLQLSLTLIYPRLASVWGSSISLNIWFDSTGSQNSVDQLQREFARA